MHAENWTNQILFVNAQYHLKLIGSSDFQLGDIFITLYLSGKSTKNGNQQIIHLELMNLAVKIDKLYHFWQFKQFAVVW